MSWLFGRKKHQKDSPPESSVEEESQSDQAGDNFVFVEKRPAPPPPTSGDGTPGTGLYPVIGGTTTFPTNPQRTLGDSASQEAPHYLNGVPFKLCKQLQRNLNDDLEIDRLRTGEILSFIERIDDQAYDYEFAVEHSVIAEMNSGNGEH